MLSGGLTINAAVTSAGSINPGTLGGIGTLTMASLILNGGTLNLDLTCVVDVFDGTIIRANAVRVGRWGKVRTACAEFATSWAMCHGRPGSGRVGRRLRK